MYMGRSIIRSLFRRYIMARNMNMARVDNMVDMLREFNYTPVEIFDSVILAENKSLRVYCDFRDDTICFGKVSDFDRWANSRDYMFEGMPDTADDLGLVLQIADDCARNNVSRGDDCAPVILNQWWRQYKRRMRIDQVLGGLHGKN